MRNKCHAVLAQDVASAKLREPINLVVAHIERWRDSEDMGVLGLAKMWDRELAADKSTPRVDLLNKIVSFDVHFGDWGQIDC